jgi:hypothetical protein
MGNGGVMERWNDGKGPLNPRFQYSNIPALEDPAFPRCHWEMQAAGGGTMTNKANRPGRADRVGNKANATIAGCRSWIADHRGGMSYKQSHFATKDKGGTPLPRNALRRHGRV